MNLIIDIGNTRSKLFVFKGDEISSEYILPKLSVSGLRKIFARHSIDACILSSVVKGDASLRSFIRKKSSFLELNHKTALPLKNRYKTKETLGNDRIANAAGAAKIFPNQNCLVIDTGTCVKYDFISSKNEYLGGAISPGMMMRFRSLHEYTSKLPFLKPIRKPKFIGASTNESIISGVQQGIINEMAGYIALYSQKYGELKVILTGGDADSFAHLFNFPIFAAPQLTATGLNEILHHNLSKK